MNNYLNLSDLRNLHTASKSTIALSLSTHTLRHVNTGEYICRLENWDECVLCFESREEAAQFRTEMGLLDHVDIAEVQVDELPFNHYWMRGEMLSRPNAPKSVSSHVYY